MKNNPGDFGSPSKFTTKDDMNIDKSLIATSSLMIIQNIRQGQFV